MKVVVLVVRDSASGSFGLPQFAAAKGVFNRDLADIVNGPDRKHAFAAHPEDFEVFELGYYDDVSATFELHNKPQPFVRLKDLVVPKN